MNQRFTQILLSIFLILSGGVAVAGLLTHNQQLTTFGEEACKYFAGPLLVALQMDRLNSASGNQTQQTSLQQKPGVPQG